MLMRSNPDSQKIHSQFEKIVQDKNKDCNLGDHLQKVFVKLIQNHPDQALEKLEEVSLLVKKGDDKAMEDFLLTEATRNYTKVAKD